MNGSKELREACLAAAEATLREPRATLDKTHRLRDPARQILVETRADATRYPARAVCRHRFPTSGFIHGPYPLPRLAETSRRDSRECRRRLAPHGGASRVRAGRPGPDA